MLVNEDKNKNKQFHIFVFIFLLKYICFYHSHILCCGILLLIQTCLDLGMKHID